MQPVFFFQPVASRRHAESGRAAAVPQSLRRFADDTKFHSAVPPYPAGTGLESQQRNHTDADLRRLRPGRQPTWELPARQYLERRFKDIVVSAVPGTRERTSRRPIKIDIILRTGVMG